MVRLAWMTDIHLDMVEEEVIQDFLGASRQIAPDLILITGDIGEAATVRAYLTRFADTLQVPIYFVLGNHDYYGGSVQAVREDITQLCTEHPLLHWLPLAGIVELAPGTALLGHGGWSDAGYGDFLNSSVMLNDYLHIQDLAVYSLDRYKLQEKLRQLGEEAATYLKPTLERACAQYKEVYVALHSPPFQECAWYEGSTPDDDNPYLPHFTCKAAGDVLLNVAAAYPDTSISVLCGHTHGDGEAQIRPNLWVQTGGAEYGNPEIKRSFMFGG